MVKSLNTYEGLKAYIAYAEKQCAIIEQELGEIKIKFFDSKDLKQELTAKKDSLSAEYNSYKNEKEKYASLLDKAMTFEKLML